MFDLLNEYPNNGSFSSKVRIHLMMFVMLRRTKVEFTS